MLGAIESQAADTLATAKGVLIWSSTPPFVRSRLYLFDKPTNLPEPASRYRGRSPPARADARGELNHFRSVTTTGYGRHSKGDCHAQSCHHRDRYHHSREFRPFPDPSRSKGFRPCGPRGLQQSAADRGTELPRIEPGSSPSEDDRQRLLQKLHARRNARRLLSI